MINLEQIQKLEARVTKAVELIKTLKTENQNLRQTLDSAQERMQELEKLVSGFKSDQKDIERCILRALENLNELEDEIKEPAAEPSLSKAETPVKAPPPAENGEDAEREEEVRLPFEAKAVQGGEGSGELDIF